MMALGACHPAAPESGLGSARANRQLSAPVQPGSSAAERPSDSLPEGTVATVDGERILKTDLLRAAELLRLMGDLPADVDLTTALLHLVERRLLLARAKQLDIRVAQSDVEEAIQVVAHTRALTPQQLEQQMLDRGLKRGEYRQEVTASLIELKLIIASSGRATGAQQTKHFRARFVGCLRASADVQVKDETLGLPDNTYERMGTVEALLFEGEVVFPEDELRRVAIEAATGDLRLCDAWTRVELALEEFYLERGYLDADVVVPWPAPSDPPITLDVRVQAGRPHVIGSITFDQSAAPRGKRLDLKELRRRLATYIPEGDVAKMSAMLAASAEVTRAFEEGDLGPVLPTFAKKPGKSMVRVNITYQLLGSEN